MRISGSPDPLKASIVCRLYCSSVLYRAIVSDQKRRTRSLDSLSTSSLPSLSSGGRDDDRARDMVDLIEHFLEAHGGGLRGGNQLGLEPGTLPVLAKML